MYNFLKSGQSVIQFSSHYIKIFDYKRIKQNPSNPESHVIMYYIKITQFLKTEMLVFSLLGLKHSPSLLLFLVLF